MHTTLRILDANINRAREGLRVIEDFVRFGMNDAALSAALKSIRHEFSIVTQTLAERAIAHRDVVADVGTHISTPSEASRGSERDLVFANCKRLGESLRSIEEHSKLIDQAVAGEVEQLRYRFYSVEGTIAQRLRPLATRFAQVRLYVLITESACRIGRDEGGGMRDEAGRAKFIPPPSSLIPSPHWFQCARAAIAGGADCLQLREKDMDGGELLRRARLLVELCHQHDVLCIINDRADVAVLSGADGVHVGQSDLSVRDARQIVGDKLVGVSTHEITHARQAMIDGADYIGVGPIFRSPTKPREFVAGLEYARQVASEIPIPAVGIAGVTIENLDQVLASGLKAVAVTQAVVGAENIKAAAREFKSKLGSAAVSTTSNIQH
jgi:thiamine-phosphate pyrophosphorylase